MTNGRQWGPTPAIPAALVVAIIAAACATVRGPRLSPPPYTLAFPTPPDSAFTLLTRALALEKLATSLPDRSATTITATSGFTLRRGGIGETRIELTFHIESDPPRAVPASAAVLRIDASARERRGFVITSAEDARNGAARQGAYPVQPEDQEALGRIDRLLKRLVELGARRN